MIQWDEIEGKALDAVARHAQSHEAAALVNTKRCWTPLPSTKWPTII